MKAADVPLVRAFVPHAEPQAGPFTKLYERVKELDRKIASFKSSKNPDGPTQGARNRPTPR
jgi:hypothetical protein